MYKRNTSNILKSLNIGETYRVDSPVIHEYLRVPGGWIVTIEHDETGERASSVFVPVPEPK